MIYKSSRVQEVVELTELLVADGMMGAFARRTAIEAVYGLCCDYQRNNRLCEEAEKEYLQRWDKMAIENG